MENPNFGIRWNVRGTRNYCNVCCWDSGKFWIVLHT